MKEDESESEGRRRSKRLKKSKPQIEKEKVLNDSRGKSCSKSRKKSTAEIDKEKVPSAYESAKQEENIPSRDTVKRPSDAMEGDKSESAGPRRSKRVKKSKEKVEKEILDTEYDNGNKEKSLPSRNTRNDANEEDKSKSKERHAVQQTNNIIQEDKSESENK